LSTYIILIPGRRCNDRRI